MFTFLHDDVAKPRNQQNDMASFAEALPQGDEVGMETFFLMSVDFKIHLKQYANT